MTSRNSGFAKQYIKCKCKPVLVAERLDTMQSITCKICAFDYLINSFLFVDKRVFVFSVPVLLARTPQFLAFSAGCNTTPVHSTK